MRILIRAGGVIRRGPEREIIDDYMQRAQRLCRAQGISQIEEIELDLKNAADAKAQTETILGKTDPANVTIVLDERGKVLSSREFARQLAQWRDDGRSSVTFHIGAADGFDRSTLPSNAQLMSFGRAVWPHKLVRIMLTEQIYRALSILAGTPYHRD